MGVLFGDDFEAVGWNPDDAGWDTHVPAEQGLLIGRGVDAGNVYGCGTAELRKVFSTPVANEGAIRAHVAFRAGTLSESIFATQVLSLESSAGGNDFLICYLALFANGVARVAFGPANSVQDFDTAPGVFPVDGSWVGVQLRVDIASSTFWLTLNNVDVLTSSLPTVNPVSFDIAQIRKWGKPYVDDLDLLGVAGAMMIALDDVEVDDSAAAVTWGAAGATPLTLDACGLLFSDTFSYSDLPGPLWDEADPPGGATNSNEGVFESPCYGCPFGGGNGELTKVFDELETPVTIIASINIGAVGTPDFEYPAFTVRSHNEGAALATVVVTPTGMVMLRINRDDGLQEFYSDDGVFPIGHPNEQGAILKLQATFGSTSQTFNVWLSKNTVDADQLIIGITTGGQFGGAAWDTVIARTVQEPEASAVKTFVGRIDNISVKTQLDNGPLYNGITNHEHFDSMSMTGCGAAPESDCAEVTEMEVINDALVKIGVTQLVEDMAEDSQESILGHQAYLRARPEILRYHPWGFATKYAAAADAEDDSDDPMSLVAGAADAGVNGDWQYAYRVPADCKFARRLVPSGLGRRYNGTPLLYRQGRRATATPDDDYLVIFTDELDPVLEYTADVQCDLSDDLFNDALGWLVASKLANGLARNKKSATECLGAYRIAVRDAALVDVREQQVAKPGPADWIAGR